MWNTSSFRRAAMALALALAAGATHAKPTPPTIEQLAAFPRMTSFTVSPDGKHLAALEGRGEERVILVWKTDELSKPPTAIGSSRMKITGVQFIKNDLLAVSMWQPYDARLDVVTKAFTTKLFITDLAGKAWNEAMPQERGMSRIQEKLRALANPAVLDSLPNDPDHILVVSDDLNSSGDVYKVNVRTNRAERVHRADEEIAGYVTDLDGNIRGRTRAAVDMKGAFIAAEIKEVASGNWVEHFRSYVKERDTVAVIGFAKDPNTAFVLSNEGLDKNVIYEYDVPSKKRKEILFKHRFFEANGIIISRNKGGGDVAFGDILGVRYDGPRGPTNDVEWTSPRMQAIDKAIREAVGIRRTALKVTDPENGQSADIEYDATTYTLGSYTDDLSTVIFTASGASRHTESFMLRGSKLTTLARSRPDVDPVALGSTRLVYYKARDGLDIPAYISRPNSELCGPGPWPAVVHPHGGPWSRDVLGDASGAWVALMTSRCMAVLRPQFRGSQGWGRKLWKAGDAEWGQKMQDDKDDGAKWLVDQGIAIKDRIAIFGFSYGGYSAMAAAVRPNGPYKCAIAGAGVSDHKRIWARFYTNPFFRERQAPTVDGLNPVDRADKLTIPILVYHGDRDQIVPLEQSDFYVSKAKAAKQPLIYHEIADYAHGPGWTRKIHAEELSLLENYLLKDCGGKGL